MAKDVLITEEFIIIPSEKFSIKVKSEPYLFNAHLFQGRSVGTTYMLDKLARNWIDVDMVNIMTGLRIYNLNNSALSPVKFIQESGVVNPRRQD